MSATHLALTFETPPNDGLPLCPINHDFSCLPLTSRRVRRYGFENEYVEEQRLFVGFFKKQTL
ncbi:hypothetical protein [Paraburkholderia sp. 40]|uniref:hypothetical protein n=1 Tax=Paraburkholderia sp. 40 TaxID=2991059 RepID=UPI003D1BFEFB